MPGVTSILRAPERVSPRITKMFTRQILTTQRTLVRRLRLIRDPPQKTKPTFVYSPRRTTGIEDPRQSDASAPQSLHEHVHEIELHIDLPI